MEALHAARASCHVSSSSASQLSLSSLHVTDSPLYSPKLSPPIHRCIDTALTALTAIGTFLYLCVRPWFLTHLDNPHLWTLHFISVALVLLLFLASCTVRSERTLMILAIVAIGAYMSVDMCFAFYCFANILARSSTATVFLNNWRSVIDIPAATVVAILGVGTHSRNAQHVRLLPLLYVVILVLSTAGGCALEWHVWPDDLGPTIVLTRLGSWALLACTFVSEGVRSLRFLSFIAVAIACVWRDVCLTHLRSSHVSD